MDFGDLDGLESILQNMQISDRPADPQRLFKVFKAVKGMLTNVMEKMVHTGLQQTEYLDINMYIDLPSTYYIEMDVPLKLNFPSIQPVRSHTGLIYLTAQWVPGTVLELLSADGYIRCDSVKNYINKKFNVVLASIPSGWSLKYIQRGRSHAQTIELKSELVTVYMNMIPVFEFRGSQWPLDIPQVPTAVFNKFPWFAVPWQNPMNNDDRAFMPYAPFWLTEMLKEMPNNILFLNLLMTWHAKRATAFPNFSAYTLKSFLLHLSVTCGVNQITKIMPELLGQIKCGWLHSFLVPGHNMLECMSFGDIQQCITTFKDLYTEAPIDMQQFWNDLHKRYPDSTFWFSNYVTFYTNETS